MGSGPEDSWCAYDWRQGSGVGFGGGDYSLLWSQCLVQGLSCHYIHFVLSPTATVSPSNFFSAFPLALATVLFAMMYRPHVLVK